MGLQFVGEKPQVGTKVIIVVDDVNSPTGIWNGTLMEVHEESHDRTGPGSLPGEKYCRCVAHITDPKAPEEYQGRAPHLNYDAYVVSSGTEYLRARLADAKNEIKGIKHRAQIERETWHAALKAITHPDSLKGLKAVLEDFLKRLGR